MWSFFAAAIATPAIANTIFDADYVIYCVSGFIGDVITFAVDLSDNTYDITTKGSENKSDCGDCSPPDVSE
ncbi:hypothetical protein [Roseovarius albus]|uniref:hypothetical protein n=1 Tax=Roseovarius albus TaxID=1247867 RepID=UPI000A271821|nr:hypothetical protein [Roseovarius albus]